MTVYCICIVYTQFLYYLSTILCQHIYIISSIPIHLHVINKFGQVAEMCYNGIGNLICTLLKEL